jgi:hypothetical protein
LFGAAVLAQAYGLNHVCLLVQGLKARARATKTQALPGALGGAKCASGLQSRLACTRP